MKPLFLLKFSDGTTVQRNRDEIAIAWNNGEIDGTTVVQPENQDAWVKVSTFLGVSEQPQTTTKELPDCAESIAPAKPEMDKQPVLFKTKIAEFTGLVYLVDKDVPLYSLPNKEGPPTKLLPRASRLRIGTSIDGMTEVTWPENSIGYIDSDTKVGILDRFNIHLPIASEPARTALMSDRSSGSPSDTLPVSLLYEPMLQNGYGTCSVLFHQNALLVLSTIEVHENAEIMLELPRSQIVEARCFSWSRSNQGMTARLGRTISIAVLLLVAVLMLVWRRQLFGDPGGVAAFISAAGVAIYGSKFAIATASEKKMTEVHICTKEKVLPFTVNTETLESVKLVLLAHGLRLTEEKAGLMSLFRR